MPFVDIRRMLPFDAGVAGYIRAMTVRPDGRYPAPSLRKRARWFLRAGPTDYLLAMSVASASLPIIGKRLEPLGAATAMGIWGYKHVPDFFSTSARSRRCPRPGGDSQAGPRVDQRRDRRRAAGHRVRSRPGDRLARAGPVRAGAEDAAAPPQPAPRLGSLWRPPVAVAGCVAPKGTARRTGAGDDLRARRRVDPRRKAIAGLCADVISGPAGLGVPVGELPGFAAQSLACSTSPM